MVVLEQEVEVLRMVEDEVALELEVGMVTEEEVVMVLEVGDEEQGQEVKTVLVQEVDTAGEPKLDGAGVGDNEEKRDLHVLLELG